MKSFLLDNLFLVTFIGAITSIMLSKLLTRKWWSPCTAYWIGWIMAIGASDMCDYLGILSPINPLGRNLIIQFHIGAFFGFLFSGIFVAITNQPRRTLKLWDTRSLASQSLERLITTLLKFLLVVSLINFCYRMYRVGGILSLSGFYFQTREVFIYDPKGLITIIFFYASRAIIPVLAYMGATAAMGRLEKRQIIMASAILMINSLATGSRAGIFGGFLFFLFGYLAFIEESRNQTHFLRVLLRHGKKCFLVLVLLVVLFEGLGAWRNYDNGVILGLKRFQGVSWWVPTTFIRYAALPTVASSALAELIPENTRLFGQMSFPWVARQLYRLDITDNIITEKRFYRRDILFTINPSLAFSQPTAVLNIATDFGQYNVWLSATLLMGIAQLVYFWSRKGGIIKLTVCANACMAAFVTNNSSWFLNGATVFSLLWAILLSFSLRKRIRHRNWKIQTHTLPFYKTGK